MEPWRGQEKLAVGGAQAQPLHWGRDKKGEGRGVYTYPEWAAHGLLYVLAGYSHGPKQWSE